MNNTTEQLEYSYYVIQLPSGRFFNLHNRLGSNQVRTALNFPICNSIENIKEQLGEICRLKGKPYPENYSIVRVDLSLNEVDDYEQPT